MKNNAFCFCPETIQKNINNPNFFIKIMNLAHTQNSDLLIIDKQQKLWLSYYEAVKNNSQAFSSLETWKRAISHTAGKIVHGNADGADDYYLVAKSSILTPLTCDKFIVYQNNENYIDHITSLRAHNIELINGFQFENIDHYKSEKISFSNSMFNKDLIKAMKYLLISCHDKSEDEYNDYIRDLLMYKGYEVKDQSRAGVSESGKSKGELDIFIWEDGHPKTIVEAVKLGSCKKDSITEHFNKLNDNYNPLQLTNTHMVVYYTGKSVNFLDFCERYKKQIDEFINDNKIGITDVTTVTNECDSDALKSFTNHGCINKQKFSCTHYIARFKEN